MSLLEDSLIPSIARIRSEKGSIYGAGVRLGSAYVLTCAHVIDAFERHNAGKPVEIDFPMITGSPSFATTVLRKWPSVHERQLDVALLQLDRPPAVGVPVPAGTGEDHYDHLVTAMGFSAGNDQGIWAEGKVLGPVSGGQVQIGSIQIRGPFIEQGFSGTAVWDKNIEAAIGIVASVQAQKELYTAYYIPLADVVGAIPELSAVVAAAKPGLPTAAERRQADWEKRARQILSYSSPIPTVSQVDPYGLGASPSKYSGEPKRTDPYIRRDIDDRLDDAIARFPFVLVAGPAMSGKSRSAYETLRRVYPNARLIVPRPSEAGVFAQLDDLSPSAFGHGENEETVIWLDDLERYLGAAGLDADYLRRWAARSPSVKVIATIRSDARQRAKETDFTSTRHIFERAHSVLLSPAMSRNESISAQEAYPEEVFIGGIGETLSGGRELLEKFDDSEYEFPVGYAIVSAAANWKRCGMNRALSDSELKLLADVMLRSAALPQVLGEEDFAAGLRWATDPVATHVALVNRPRDRSAGYVVVDFIESRLAERGAEIPLDFWQALTELSTLAEAAYIGITAWQSGSSAAATGALEKGIGAPDPEAARRAKLAYMLVLGRQAKTREARAVYEELNAQDPDDLAPTLNMAAVLSQVDAKEEAKQLLVDASRSAQPTIAAVAGLNLADILAAQGDSTAAVAALERARSLNSAEAEPLIAIRLGELFERMNLPERAQSEYQKASAAAVPNISGKARIALASLLFNAGAKDDGRAMLEQATRSGDPESAGHAFFLLGASWGEDGEVARAEEAYRGAIASGNSAFAGLALFWRGELRRRTGRRDEARKDFARASNADPETAVRAGYALAELANEDRDTAALCDAFQRIVDAGHPQHSPLAAIEYGDLLVRLNRAADAVQLYVIAVETGSAEASAQARSRLDQLVSSGAISEDQVQIATSRPPWYDIVLRRSARGADGNYVTVEMAAEDGATLHVIAGKSGRPLIFPINPAAYGLGATENSRAVLVPGTDRNVVVLLTDAGRPSVSDEKLRNRLSR
jgi:cellulose synthase operon protein C